MKPPMRLIIGISGSSGVIYGIRLLETLRAMPEVETHLVISQGAKLNIAGQFWCDYLGWISRCVD